MDSFDTEIQIKQLRKKYNLNVKIKAKDNSSVFCFSIIKRITEKSFEVSSFSDEKKSKRFNIGMVRIFNIKEIELSEYNDFIKEEIVDISKRTTMMFKFFNTKYKEKLSPTSFNTKKILEALQLINADNLSVFDDSELNDFYPAMGAFERLVNYGK